MEGEEAEETAREVGEPDRALWWMPRALGSGRYYMAGGLRFLSFYAHFISAGPEGVSPALTSPPVALQARGFFPWPEEALILYLPDK